MDKPGQMADSGGDLADVDVDAGYAGDRMCDGRNTVKEEDSKI